MCRLKYGDQNYPIEKFQMDYTVLVQGLRAKFGDKIVSTDETADVFTLVIDSTVVFEFVKSLKDDHGFIFLTDLCGIHYPGQEKEFGVIYHLHNLTENARIRIKTFVTRANPVVSSITELFSGANWMERETFDFYGVQFEGHPNLIRILNVEFMDYFPMRKEYPLEDATRDDKDDRFFGR